MVSMSLARPRRSPARGLPMNSPKVLGSSCGHRFFENGLLSHDNGLNRPMKTIVRSPEYSVGDRRGKSVNNNHHYQSPVLKMGNNRANLTPSPKPDNYAGAKFHEPPSPTALPKPPSHWMKPLHGGDSEMSFHLKSILHVMTH